MKISAQEEYGLRCLLQLARAELMGASLTLPQLARLEGISTANAGKLMWILSKAGLVQSTRGIKGGYLLSRPASEIRLNQVIRVLEGEPAESHHLFPRVSAPVLGRDDHHGRRRLRIRESSDPRWRSGGSHPPSHRAGVVKPVTMPENVPVTWPRSGSSKTSLTE